jgi:hypothetical protein
MQIAWSVTCGIVCLALIVLWVRSYYFIEALQVGLPFIRVRVFSESGAVVTWIVHNTNREGSHWMTMPHNEVFSLFSIKSFGTVDEPTSIQVPHWLLVILSASFATSAWFSCRYGLRTLLIATTLVAVALGLAVALR